MDFGSSETPDHSARENLPNMVTTAFIHAHICIFFQRLRHDIHDLGLMIQIYTKTYFSHEKDWKATVPDQSSVYLV